MNFVAELPESGDFNAIVVVTDQFTKVQHYIPAKATWTAEYVADSYMNNMWKLHGLARDMNSDRSTQFAMQFL